MSTLTYRSIADAALEVAAKGLPVFPCRPDKTPATKNGLHDATTEPAKIRGMFTRDSLLIGVATGAASGFTVLDEDPRSGGDADALNLPETLAAETPSGGRHFYFKDAGIRNSASKIAPGIDVRGEGGYVIVPPSEGYRWINNDSSLAEFPAWLLDRKSHTFRNESVDVAATRNGVVEGARNDQIYRGICSYRARNLPVEDALDFAREAAVNSDPPYIPENGDEDVDEMVYRVYGEYPPGEYPEPADTTPTLAAQSFHRSDMGNADRFDYLYGDDYRYVPAWKKFIVWTGKRWEIDDGSIMGQLAEQVVRAMYAEAAQIDDKSDRKAMNAHANGSESLSRRNAMIGTLKNRRTVSPSELDTDDYLLNVNNGTIDLRTGNLKQHDRQDLITKLAPVDFDPKAKAPLWGSVNRRVLPDVNVRDYVQRSLGCALTGDASEHALFMPTGTGRNGKNTILDATMDVMGDYAATTAPDLLLDSKSHPTDVADLLGVRLAVTSEVNENSRFDAAKLKRLTGDKYRKARRMGEDFWTFKRTDKIFMLVNHRPDVSDTSNAIWDRLKLIPFNVTIPQNERDRQLNDKLQAELPGILAWLVRGCLRWQRDGLNEPKAVTEAVEEYRAEQDTLQAFISDRCTVDVQAVITKSELFSAWEDWCLDANERPGTSNKFTRRLKDRGFEDGHNTDKTARVWFGIKLSDTSDTSDSLEYPEHEAVNLELRGPSPRPNRPNCPDRVIDACRRLLDRYRPGEISHDQLIESRGDPEYWQYRLQDARLGEFSEESITAALDQLQASGELEGVRNEKEQITQNKTSASQVHTEGA